MIEVVGVELHRVAVRVQCDRPQEIDVAEHLHRYALVDAHPRELFLGELARLVEQLVGNDELADVVHQRAEAQALHPGRHEIEFLADVTGVDRHPFGVTGGVRVLLLERADEKLHGFVVRLLHSHVRREHLTRRSGSAR